MRWVLEHNLTDFGYQTLIKVLERYGIDFTMVKVIPYQNILVSPDFDTFEREATEKDNIFIDNNEKLFPFGTMGLSRVAVERNWKPGSLYNQEFNFEKWSQGFGVNNLLNSESKILRFGDYFDYEHEVFFVRPCEDNKAFSGQVMNKEKFLKWQKIISKVNDQKAKLNNDTMITVAPHQYIMKEARMFVVDGKVITGSYYRFGLKVQYQEVKDGDPIIKYTEKVISNYQPAKAFVIDIAETEKGYSIIEINNINSVGLYHANVNKLVESIMSSFA